MSKHNTETMTVAILNKCPVCGDLPRKHTILSEDNFVDLNLIEKYKYRCCGVAGDVQWVESEAKAIEEWNNWKPFGGYPKDIDDEYRRELERIEVDREFARCDAIAEEKCYDILCDVAQQLGCELKDVPMMCTPPDYYKTLEADATEIYVPRYYDAQGASESTEPEWILGWIDDYTPSIKDVEIVKKNLARVRLRHDSRLSRARSRSRRQSSHESCALYSRYYFKYLIHDARDKVTPRQINSLINSLIDRYRPSVR